MIYREAIEYLYSLTDYEKKRIERYTPETLDLTRIERLLSELGDPHHDYPVVHIAGTKGKGSTAAMVEAVLRAAGYRTGFYTSPHLHTFRERIQVDGELISHQDVIALVEEVQPLVTRIPGVTTFEAITAMAFTYFSRREIDVLIAEVGLGGRLDATNVLQPEVAVITSISRDHTYLLGNSLPEIAYEKAGIVKEGLPVVSAPQRPEALHAIEEVSQSRHAPLVEAGRDWTWEPGPFDLQGQSFTVHYVGDESSDLEGEYWTPLLGHHQLENGTTAIATLHVLRERGFDIPRSAVEEGLRNVEWPGRMEVLSSDPLVIADCAHNPYSMQALRTAIETWFPDRKWVLIYGAFIDKDIRGMIDVLLPLVDTLIVTRSEHPRATAPVAIADTVAAAGGGAEVAVNMSRAFDRALAEMEPGDGILVTGSVSLVGEAREAWAERTSQTVPENDQ
jgi:dihydrofolate synthase/folylpolyglutamate synthase